MDHYRKTVIELVRNQPLLWDPANQDYKNADQRKQVWEDINAILHPPAGCNVTAKATWEHLTRGFSNALRRKEKRSGSSTASDKAWKFEQDLMFLLPVKKTRSIMTGNLDSAIYSDDYSDVSHSDTSQIDTEDAGYEGVVFNGQRESKVGRVEEVTMKPSVDKLLTLKRKREKPQEMKDENELINPVQQRQESSRLNFFMSIMPKVDSLTDDEFLDFQIEVLQVLKKQKSTTVHPS